MNITWPRNEHNLAKAVLMRREDGYFLAIVPASCHVQIESLGKWLREPIELATETEASIIFGDCDLGSVPHLADAYGLMVPASRIQAKAQALRISEY